VQEISHAGSRSLQAAILRRLKPAATHLFSTLFPEDPLLLPPLPEGERIEVRGIRNISSNTIPINPKNPKNAFVVKYSRAKQTSSVKTVQSNSILSIVLKYPIAKFGNFLYSSTIDKILIVRQYVSKNGGR